MNPKNKVPAIIVVVSLLTSFLVGFTSPTRMVLAQSSSVLINEIRVDQTSTDNDEYFELVGAAGASLDGLTYLVIGDGTGGSGVIEAVVDLGGSAIPGSGYFVAAESTFSLGTADLTTSLNFENDDNVTHLLVSDFSGANGDDLDTDDDGVLDVTPWTQVLDLIALIEEENPPSGTEYHYGPPSIGPDGSYAPGHVFLCSEGWEIGEFDPASGDDTPGAANACAVEVEVDISEIRIDQTSTDNDEYFELVGTAGASLDGLTYLVIGDGTGGSGVIEAVVDLSGQIIPGSGYFVAAESTFSLGTADLTTSLNFENDDNVTHLLVSGFSGANGDDLDTDDDGVLDVTPWTEILDLIALIEEENPPSGTEYHYGPPSVGPDGAYVPGHAFLCSGGWEIGEFDPTAGDDTPGAANACPPPSVLISEVRIDQTSTDNDEYFELAGAAGAALDGLTYLVIGDGTGGSGVIEAVVGLSGQTIPGSGYFVAAESTFTLGTADLTTDLNFENSDNVTHLLVSGFTGSDGDDLDTDDDGVLDVTPWTEILDLIALIEEENPPSGTEYHYGPPSVGPDDAYVPGHAFLCSEGWEIGEFDLAAGDDTPGAENACVTDVCGDPATFIHAIQGSGDSSPEVGNSHVIEGVVVGDFQDTSTQLRGFFLQEEDGEVDGDGTTSEGIFVYDPGFTLDVNVGDVVRVAGSVSEYHGLTELGSVSKMEICSSGNSVAVATINLPVSSLDVWEQHEGMLINIPGPLFVTDNYDLGYRGEVDLSIGDRLDNPTNVVAPGAPAIALQELNDRSHIQLDDGSTVSNPEPLPPYLGPDNTLRAGDTTPELTGVLGCYDSYEVHPTGTVDFARVNTRDATPPQVGGTLKVASFNVLNYFSTIDTGAWICGPSGDMECRGADNTDEFERQRTKIIAAIVMMDADVIGLMEMENHPTDEALQDLVSGLNDAAGAGTYAYIDTGVIGTDAIKVAFIYKPGAVTPYGSYAILDSSVDPAFNDQRNRPVLAQTFEENATGEGFTVAVNHLKSKGTPCTDPVIDDPLDPDMGDGQGNCNLTRTAAAEALVNWLAGDPTGSGDPDFLIIGDLNSYAMEDPITAIKDAGYTNLLETFIGADAYSYVFYGQAGYLDHALSNPDLTAQVTGVVEWHINADEPSALDYNDYNQDALYNPDQYRASDHDPVIVGLGLDSSEPLEDVDLSYAHIQWRWCGDGRASFYLQGELKLPPGYTRHDLSRDLTLSLTIADVTGSDSVSFRGHGRLWRYYGLDGPGDGMDIRYASIHWLPRRAYFTVSGDLNLPGVNQDTEPAEATIGMSLPVATAPDPAARLVGETTVSFWVHGKWWRYYGW
jgi:predicted extracellular nuclease/uncharacterized membrane protein